MFRATFSNPVVLSFFSFLALSFIIVHLLRSQCETGTVARPSVQRKHFPSSLLLFAKVFRQTALDLRKRRAHDLAEIPLFKKLVLLFSVLNGDLLFFLPDTLC